MTASIGLSPQATTANRAAPKAGPTTASSLRPKEMSVMSAIICINRSLRVPPPIAKTDVGVGGACVFLCRTTLELHGWGSVLN